MGQVLLKCMIGLLLFLVTSGISVLGQTSLTSPGKYFLFKNYTTQNGLMNNGIYSLAQDRNGFIWIGHDFGLTRFDGKTFFHKAVPEIYLHSAMVRLLETTPDGYLLFTGFMQGVFAQQKDGRFKRYLRSEQVEIRKNTFNTLKYISDNSLLTSEANALYHITGDSIKTIYDYGSSRGFFYTIDIDKEQQIWFGGRLGLGRLQLSGEDYKPVFLPEMQNKFILKILFDDAGTLHVATSQGYYRIRWLTDNQYVVEQPFDAVRNTYITHLYLDNASNLWILTNTYGAFQTQADSITIHLTQENGLLSSTVLCMIQDRENNYWFGTENGINMIENFNNYAIAQNGKRFKEANGMMPDRYQRIWIHSRSQLHLLMDDRLKSVSLNGTPLEKNGIGHLTIFNDKVIMSNQTGLYQLPATKDFPDLRKIRKLVDYSAYNITQQHSLRADTTGIWITSQNKIYNYCDGQFLPVTFNHPDSSSLRPLLMKPDKYGYYWYGDLTDGLYRGVLSRPDKHTLLFDSITVYKSNKADSAFVTAWIYRLVFDNKDNLWFSSAHTGVYKLKINNQGVEDYQLYSTATGLLNNFVMDITCDEGGKIWISSQKGINVLQTDKDGEVSMDKIDINEGIEGQVLNPLQIGDKLYLLTEEGMYITQNQLFKETSESKPNVYITNLIVNGLAHSDFSTNTQNIHLSHIDNNLTFEYSAISFKNVNDLRYRYKLEGSGVDWSALSDRGFVEYASLRPGSYTFKVQVALVGRGEPVYSTDGGASLSFRITPAFYQTVWFYSLIAMGILSLLYTFHRYRLRHVIKVERMRARIASDLHDEIGSTLSSISLISEMVRKKDYDSELTKALNKIGIDSREVLNSMDDIIWSVNPKNDSLSYLVTRLREYAIPVCESKNITFDMHIDKAIHTLKLEMEQRRNIYLITKESINNAVKYSGCTLLTVVFNIVHKQLEINITDNGCGFDPTLCGSRNGIINMKRRAAQIGMRFSIQSEKNAGTHITLKTSHTT